MSSESCLTAFSIRSTDFVRQFSDERPFALERSASIRFVASQNASRQERVLSVLRCRLKGNWGGQVYHGVISWSRGSVPGCRPMPVKRLRWGDCRWNRVSVWCVLRLDRGRSGASPLIRRRSPIIRLRCSPGPSKLRVVLLTAAQMWPFIPYS
jgi:hypothetical protein